MLAASVPGHGCLLYHVVLYPAYCCADLALLVLRAIVSALPLGENSFTSRNGLISAL